MKTYYNVYADTDVVDALRKAAAECEIAQGDLLGLLVRHGLERLKPEAIRAWAAKRSGQKGRRAGALTADETALIDAVAQLHRAEPIAARFTLADLQRVCSLPPRELYRGALRLQERGLTAVAMGDKRDRWDRPVNWSVGLSDAGRQRQGVPALVVPQRWEPEPEYREASQAVRDAVAAEFPELRGTED